MVELRDATVLERLEKSIKAKFELTPSMRTVPPGSIAREFESTVKALRFVDKRS
jgi:hypothetical protein